ncbi:MAG: Trk family potassium uptake protein [Oscillospiraceae bacterium]|nr:Trk family potassium uptake protein [Oscillospiraceae bacterium]
MKIKNPFGKQSTSAFQMIIVSFLCIILVGTLLLLLPFATKEGNTTTFSDALFTSVSATCVTGLTVKDTATHWTVFGQAVILLLVQIGGMGVITISVGLVGLTGKKIGLRERSTIQESISAPQLGGIVKFIGFIIKTTIVIEIIGTLLFLPVFCKEFGAVGIWYAFFHSISAFCSSGFDLMGVRGEYSSLMIFADNVYMNIIFMTLVSVGGMGFLTWEDIREHKFRFKKYSLQSKVILIASLVLIVIPAMYFFIFEYTDVSMGKRVLYSLFHSVSARTAGFSTTDFSAMSDSGKVVTIAMMLVGGSPGSTAGGMKVTTVTVLILAAFAVFGRKKDVKCLDRRLPEDVVRSSGAIFFIYMALFITSAAIISRIENLPILTCLFETGSATGTAGLTLGLTPLLSTPSRIIIMFLMFFGRLGGLTMIYAALPSGSTEAAKMPLEKITVG